MSNLQEIIKNRRSVRKFLSKSVPKDLILEILQAAGWAPSAHNSQPWRFILLQDANVKADLAKRMADAWAADLKNDGLTAEESIRLERMERFANAPALIIACLTMEGLRKFPDKNRQSYERDLAVESLGAGLENLLLTAHASGLGACWYCAPAFCKDIVRDVLKIPDSVEPSALIILGYPDESPSVPPKKELKEYFYLDKYGQAMR
jgi:F420 biosynthesis protein FbiB-like protein